MLAEVIAPDDLSGEAAMRPRYAIDLLIHHQREGSDKAFVSVRARYGAFHEALAIELENTFVGEAAVRHPAVDGKEILIGRLAVCDFQIAGA